jgi:hypothetical protein
MFPINERKLSIADVANYWSREIHPPASQMELLATMVGAWWGGDLLANLPVSRVVLLKQMFKSMHGRADAGLVFVTPDDPGPPEVTELSDGGAEVDVRPRIPVPSNNPEDWSEPACGRAFEVLAKISSVEGYGDFVPVLFRIELCHDEFTSWLRRRRYDIPSFWKPQIVASARRRKTALDETSAIEALASHLKSNPELTRAQAEQCCKAFGYAVSDRGFQNRVWPKARVQAGLPEKALPGRREKSSR